MSNILSEIIQLMVGGITGIASGVGAGLSTLATSVFLDTAGDTRTLSVFGSLVVIFAGISLSIGLCRWIVNFVTSLGARNR